jgi:geranylgeranyl diphosphate synthase type II
VELKAYLAQRRGMVDQALDGFLPAGADGGGQVIEAMRYSLFAGGKRVRPILCLAGAEAAGGGIENAMFCACAMEMIHTYSLIHDDLPAMDDDDYRRGKPTNHKVYGDGMAILAGDGLLTLAGMLLTGAGHYNGLDPARVLAAASCVMTAAGHLGMVGGQARTFWPRASSPTWRRCSSSTPSRPAPFSGPRWSPGPYWAAAVMEPSRYAPLRPAGRPGLSDRRRPAGPDRRPGKLGKAVGMDQARGKMTYPGVVGPEAARKEGQRLVEKRPALPNALGPPAEPLGRIWPLYIMERTH